MCRSNTGVLGQHLLLRQNETLYLQEGLTAGASWYSFALVLSTFFLVCVLRSLS